MSTSDDFIRRENEHARRMAEDEFHRKMRLKTARRETMSTVFVFIVVMTIIVGGGWMLWRGLTGDYTSKAELACIESGGVWADVNDGGSTCWRLTK